jgi:hypothetical protein
MDANIAEHFNIVLLHIYNLNNRCENISKKRYRMKNRILVFIFVLLSYMSFSQEIDSDLLFIKKRLDSIVSYTADVDLETDISFINMPRKKASLTYSKGKDLKFSSDDFVMLPKRGLDFSLNELFKYEFITLYRGTENIDGIDL